MGFFMRNITLIKRYQNRKLYDTANHMYITLAEIRDRILNGEEFKCFDNKTGQDITNTILKQVLLTKSFTTDKLKELILYEKETNNNQL